MPSRSGLHARISRAARLAACMVAACGIALACSKPGGDSAPSASGASASPAATSSVATSPVAAAAQPVTELTPELYMVATRAGNMAVLVEKDSSLLVGPQLPSLDSAARALLAEHHAGPVRMVVATSADSAPEYADGGWGHDGALVLAHENLRARMTRLRRSGAPLPPDAQRNALPTLGFSEVVQMYVSGNAVHAIHHHAGSTDADLIVHFENPNVIYLGNTLTTDGYPAIDVSRGGSIAGMIQTIDSFKDFPAQTRFIPGRGPVASIQVLHSYDSMLTGVLGRVKRAMDAGQSEAQVIASKLTASYDATWGHGPVSPDAFVRMVYESLTADSAQR